MFKTRDELPARYVTELPNDNGVYMVCPGRDESVHEWLKRRDTATTLVCTSTWPNKIRDQFERWQEYLDVRKETGSLF